MYKLPHPHTKGSGASSTGSTTRFLGWPFRSWCIGYFAIYHCLPQFGNMSLDSICMHVADSFCHLLLLLFTKYVKHGRHWTGGELLHQIMQEEHFYVFEFFNALEALSLSSSLHPPSPSLLSRHVSSPCPRPLKGGHLYYYYSIVNEYTHTHTYIYIFIFFSLL